MKWFNQLRDKIRPTILCLRFPFLYPRNRFTGLHYHSYDFLKKIQFYSVNGNPSFFLHKIYYKDAVDSKTEGWGVVKTITYSDCVTFDKKTVLIYRDNNNIILSCGKKTMTIPLCDLWDESKHKFIKDVKFQIIEEFSKFNKETNRSVTISVIYDNPTDVLPTVFKSFNFKINPYYAIKAKILSFYYRYILQIIHCLPSYTELDAMPGAWKKFGIQMCKDIRKALLHEGIKSFFNYRIIDIKEKWGSLRWVDNSSLNSKVNAVVSKYQQLSSKTCFNCGKKAKYRTIGYILPYCENCIDKKYNYEEITD